MSDIIWPERYLPGTTDNYVSNEIIVAGLSAPEVWPYLAKTTPNPMLNAHQEWLDGLARRALGVAY